MSKAGRLSPSPSAPRLVLSPLFDVLSPSSSTCTPSCVAVVTLILFISATVLFLCVLCVLPSPLHSDTGAVCHSPKQTHLKSVLYVDLLTVASLLVTAKNVAPHLLTLHPPCMSRPLLFHMHACMSTCVFACPGQRRMSMRGAVTGCLVLACLLVLLAERTEGHITFFSPKEMMVLKVSTSYLVFEMARG